MQGTGLSHSLTQPLGTVRKGVSPNAQGSPRGTEPPLRQLTECAVPCRFPANGEKQSYSSQGTPSLPVVSLLNETGKSPAIQTLPYSFLLLHDSQN